MHARSLSDANTSTSLSATPDTMSRHPNGSDPMADPMAACELEFVDLVGVMDEMEQTDELNNQRDTNDETLILESQETSDACFVVALFCDGFVCRHWTSKSGWVEGFAQSYDATSRYFLECLEKERLPDGLHELLEQNDGKHELLAELWDLRSHPTALCPLTSADLPRSAPRHLDGASVHVRHLVLRTHEQLIQTESANTKQQQQHQHELSSLHPASDQFPQLSNADLEALTNDELASLALGPETDLLQVEADLDLLDQVDASDDGNGFELLSADAVSPPIHNGRSPVDILLDDGALIDDGHDFDDLITPKANGIGNNDTYERTSQGSAMASPTPYLSPTDTKAKRPLPDRKVGSPESGFLSPAWIHKDSAPDTNKFDSLEDSQDWMLNSPATRSVEGYEHGEAAIKQESSVADGYFATKQKTPKKPKKPKARVSSTLEIEEKFLSSPASSPIQLTLSRDNFDWTDQLKTPTAKPKKPKKKSKKHLKPAINSDVPLPATHLFLSRIHGKRTRHYTIDQIDSTSPPWMMARHMGGFFQAALVFERRHAQFLQVNVERIMTANHMPVEPTKIAAGSMHYLAMQLTATCTMARPDQVIAAAAHLKKPTETPPSPKLRHISPQPASGKLSGLRSPTAVASVASPRGFRNRARSPQSPRSPILEAAYLAFDERKATSPPSSLPPLSPFRPGARSHMSWCDTDILDRDGHAFEY